MGRHLRDMHRILEYFVSDRVIDRIWKKDHTLWKPDPTEISNRLGWLQIIDTMSSRLPEIMAFADEIKESGFRHVVLLGMGGSSLGPEVIRQTCGSAPGYPELIVLDSTLPGALEAVIKSIVPETTLFIVSSKSGTTIETMALYRFFRSLVEKAESVKSAGKHFTAITDEGTPLARLAAETGFRRIFINPSDIGGRYSVLSYFGIVPAIFTGINPAEFLRRAEKMQERCAPCADIYLHPGAWLGTLTGHLASIGRDKLTLITSPSITSIGLWIEQLLAESTGKEGKGIIPVTAEPRVDTENYGKDRVFIYIRMKDDANAKTDEAVIDLETAGQPVIHMQIDDAEDLGSQFFLWEFATAVAGIILRINPFDQPDVQSAKDAARQVLQEYESSGKVLENREEGFLDKLLKQAKKGNYLAINAFIPQTSAVDHAFARFRRAVLERYHIATTLGYGPRYLHSTGQVHKGGPNNGLFIQIAAPGKKDYDIPWNKFSFGTLSVAEALGDYRALAAKGRKSIRLQLGNASGAAVDRLFETLA